MGLSNNINQYTDIKRVLDATLEHWQGKQDCPPVHYKLKTKGEAIRWRQRAYQFRKLAVGQKHEQLGGIPGMTATTPYDSLRLGLENNTVVINITTISGVLETSDGDQLEFTDDTPTQEPVDPLLVETLKLVEELGED